jgi:Ca2+-binding EF-hand superfamily protein
MRQYVIAIAAAMLLAAPAVEAGQRHKWGAFMEDTFKAIDRDGSGSVTQAELDAHRAQRFDAADGNGDGRITLDEAIAQEHAKAEERAKRWIGHQDADGDGAVTMAEIGGGHGRKLMKADADGDGAVTLEELRARMEHGDDGDDG